jgi:MFS family permease
LIHSLRAFRHRNYRLVFCGQSLAILGNWIQYLAMTWLVYRLSGSAWLLGVAGFASQIGILVLAPFAGLWADRFDRRKLLLATQFAAMVPGFALSALAWTGTVEIWHVVVLSALVGVVMAIEVPVRQTFTPALVPAREDLPSAIAFNALMQNGGRMLGPTIAGVLIAVSGEAICFFLNGASKIVAVATLMMITVTPTARAAVQSSAWRSLKEGLAYTWNSLPLRWLLPVVALVTFLASPYQTLMPIFAAEVFAGGADTLGVLIGAAGLGGITGMLLLASRKDVRGLTTWIAASALVAGATLIVFSYSKSFELSLATIAIVGLTVLTVAMGVSTIIQTVVEDRMRGRVMGLFTVSFMGMFPLGSLAAGAAADWIGPQHTLAAGGFACMLTGLWLWRKLPELRRQMRPIYVRLGIINE